MTGGRLELPGDNAVSVVAGFLSGVLGILVPMPALLTGLLGLVLPTACVCCGAAGGSWCVRCRCQLDGPVEVRRPRTLGAVPAFAVAEYVGGARRVVLAHKERGRRELAAPIGLALAEVLPWLAAAQAQGWWLVPAPSRRSAARARGGQHMLGVARQCAAALAAAGHRAAVAPALRASAGARDSVGLDAAARWANLAGRIRFRPAGAPPRGASVVLLDDVITTGVTAAACVRALSGAGVTVSCVLAFTAAGRGDA
ncbi:MAG: ComF family protein [Sciscionella sp.]